MGSVVVDSALNVEFPKSRNVVVYRLFDGVCSQGQHSHNTSQGGWRHNPKTAGSAAAVKITKITGTQKRYGYTFYLV
ncbi:MAG: hypothetical protein WCF06_15105 [Nitrososphaeraceae archaeon]